MSATAGLSSTRWPLRELTDLLANGGGVSQPSPSMEEDQNALFLSQYRKNIFINRYLFQILWHYFEEVQPRRSPSQSVYSYIVIQLSSPFQILKIF
jgi:hypothetical protein